MDCEEGSELNITTGRPGVFSEYTVETYYPGEESRAVGIVCGAGGSLPLEAVKITGKNDLARHFQPDGEGETLYRTALLLMENGVRTLYCVPVCAGETGERTAESYRDGLALLEKQEDIYAVLCDRDDAEVLAALKQHVVGMSDRQRERLGFAAPCSPETDPLEMAKALASERMCVCAPMASVGGVAHGVFLAAATAAACVGAADPSAGLSGFAPKGIAALSEQAEEEKIEQWIAGGVTAYETVGAGIELIRLVSTRTAAGGAPDNTFRSLNTVMIIDDVLGSVRDALKLRLAGAKNNEASRGAIKTQAAVELKKKRDAGIIEDYATPVVTPSGEDPAVCVVELAFRVCTAVNQIHITAFVSV